MDDDVELKDGDQVSLVNGSCLVAFAEGVSASNKRAVLGSTLLAQERTSDVDGDDDAGKLTQDRFSTFRRTLEKGGFQVVDSSFDRYRPDDGELEVQKATKRIFDVIGDSAARDAIRDMLEAFRKEGKNSGPISVFGRSSITGKAASFQLAVVDQKDGAARMSMGWFYLKTEKDITRVFFIPFSSQSTKLFTASLTMRLDAEAYAKAEPGILAELTRRAQDVVRKIDLG